MKKFLSWLRKKFDWLIKKKDHYDAISNEEYFKKFGIELDTTGNFKVIDGAKEKLDHAYTKAWENRTFEIEKFWTRAAYFWGFIVLIFGGYITVLTSEHATKAFEMHLDLYLVLLGFLFSITWFLVILGSKTWQGNWEAHIDMLEDYVSGPLYKTIYYKRMTFYSVSRLNELMSIAVLLVWSGLLIQHLIQNYTFTFNLFKADLVSTLSVLGTTIFSIVLVFGYSSGHYKANKQGFIERD